MSTCIDIAEELGQWPNCAVPDCPNKACLTLGSDRCFPHSCGLFLDDERIPKFADALLGPDDKP